MPDRTDLRPDRVVYLHDGSFDGLLCAVFDCFRDGRRADGRIAPAAGLQPDLTERYLRVAADPAKAARVRRGIREKLSDDVLMTVYEVHLSECADAGTLIREFLAAAFETGPDILSRLTLDPVDRALKASLALRREAHKYTGFVRFRKLAEGVYYAPIRPKGNVLELLAPHFADRMRNMCWMIHDTRRGVAAVFDTKAWSMTDRIPDLVARGAWPEDEYVGLWKEFYRRIAIESRTNVRLRRSHMPLRYWDRLTEME
jgi:probable DNA metabolism protein